MFYWGGGKWNSVGRQMAVSDSIVYSGFQGALFYLKNHTAGKDERIFEYKRRETNLLVNYRILLNI